MHRYPTPIQRLLFYGESSGPGAENQEDNIRARKDPDVNFGPTPVHFKRLVAPLVLA